MFIEINVLYTVYSERRTLDVVLVPGCLFNISSHKVRLNSKGWASLKKGANLKITVPYRLTRKMWTLKPDKMILHSKLVENYFTRWTLVLSSAGVNLGVTYIFRNERYRKRLNAFAKLCTL